MSSKQQSQLSMWLTKNNNTTFQNDDSSSVSSVVSHPSSNPGVEIDTPCQIPSSIERLEAVECSSTSNRSDARNTGFLDVRHLSKSNQSVNFKFPRDDKKGGNYGRSFQSSWFNTHKWLHYDEGNDTAFCFICLKAKENQSLSQFL